MNRELFGVFGDRDAFARHRSPSAFDRLVEGSSLTVGLRSDPAHRAERVSVAEDGDDVAVVWGEAFVPSHRGDPATWLLEEYPETGEAALDALNGSFVAVVDGPGDPLVAADPVRTRECFYTDATPERAFGTDPLAVADLLQTATVDREALLEFVHMGVVLGDRSVFSDVRRVPFDGYVTADDAGALSRFVYDAREFDYVDSLARRLERAIERRSGLPGRTALLLSAGYDSRVFLSKLDDVDAAYTVGTPGSDETAVSRRLAAEYDVPHRVLDPSEGYLNTEPGTVQYGQGVKESIHVHHAVRDGPMNADAVHHGLLFDTLLAGHFRPRRSVDVLGHPLPLRGLDPDPDLADVLLFDNFGYWPVSDRLDSGDQSGRASTAFCRDALKRERDRLADRFDNAYDAIAAVGVQNQPTTPFHAHLADNYLATFVAADAELVDWHLHTPPEHRNERTYRRALERIDDSLLDPRPPDRPHDSYLLNQVQKFLRKTVPGLAPFETAWPDRDEHYARSGLDDELFRDDSVLRDLPPRMKLRLNDVGRWVECATGDVDVVPPATDPAP